VITHNKNGLFSSRITAVSGKNGAYVVSTAKQGIFEKLSTWFYESASPPFGKTKWIYKIIYADNVSKGERLEIHDKMVGKIESMIESYGDSKIAGEGSLELMLGFNALLNELISQGFVKDIIDSYPNSL
jgi:hypothetical protein